MDAEQEAVPSTEEASSNFYWLFGKEQVFNLQTTVRGAMSPAQVTAHLNSVKAALMAVVGIGGMAKAVGKQPDNLPAPAVTTAVKPTNGDQPEPGLVVPVDVQTFPAELLVGSIIEGKASWKVKGGRWTQFGVTVWPETLPAVIDGKKVENGNTYPLVGFTAYYVNKPDGKPQKVVRLVKA